MGQNRQRQKIVNPHTTRIRHRRRLLVSDPRFAARHPGLANFLDREAARANATPLRIDPTFGQVDGGSGWETGDKVLVVGGTFTIQAIAQVGNVIAGSSDFLNLIDPGEYTIAPGLGAATVPTQVKNGRTPGTGIVVDADVLTFSPTGVTAAEILGGLRGQTDVSGNLHIITRARHFRTPRQTEATYFDRGVPVS